MNAHLIRIVEGPQAGDVVAANDAVFDPPSPRKRDSQLTLVSTPRAAEEKNSEQDDYVLGGYAGI
jgi:hypothetical protein